MRRKPERNASILSEVFESDQRTRTCRDNLIQAGVMDIVQSLP